jgi:chromosome segregation protein
MKAIRREAERLGHELRFNDEQREALGGELERLRSQQELARRRVDELDNLLLEQSQRVTQVREAQPRVAEQTQALRDARALLSELVSRHERALAASVQLEAERRSVREEMERELGPRADLPTAVVDAPTDDEVRRLRVKSAQYAEVDESVIDEWRELSQRQQFLQGQVDDLRAASENLTRIMNLADREMRERYAAAFRSVSEEFARVFRLMFQGGEAGLEEIDDEGSVEVRAQLPGRRSHSSAAFSGGERSLVASSLLFGVLRIRPTPFCILDEVDAALDENNVDRFLTVLRDLSEQTQMIVVTHNRATMAAADVLYGLTMDDHGVSSLLSLRLDSYEPAV